MSNIQENQPFFTPTNKSYATWQNLAIILALTLSVVALVIASIPSVNSFPSPTTSFTAKLASPPGRIVSIDDFGNIVAGAGLSVLPSTSPFDINDRLSHIEMCFFGKDIVIVLTSSDGILVGRLQPKDVVTWNNSKALPGISTVDGFVALSPSRFVILSGSKVMVGSVNLDTLAVTLGSTMNYTKDYPVIDPIIVTMSEITFAISFFCHGSTSICGIVGIVSSDNVATFGPEAVWSVNDHTFHDLVSLNSSTLVFFCPLDDPDNNTYAGPLSATVARVDLTDGVITVGIQTVVPLPDQLNNFFSAVAMNNDSAVVCFPDTLLNEGLRCVALRFESLTSVSVVATLRPGVGGADAMYVFMSMQRIDATHFAIGYVNSADNNKLSLIVCEFAEPGAGLVESFPTFELTQARSSNNVLWLTMTADLATATFFVAYSQVNAGGRLAIGHLKNPPLGFSVDKESVQVAGLIEPGFVVVPGVAYFCTSDGDLVMGSTYSTSTSQTYVINPATGGFLTQLAGVGVTSTQIALQFE